MGGVVDAGDIVGVAENGSQNVLCTPDKEGDSQSRFGWISEIRYQYLSELQLLE